jgi:hypothetical protein
MGNSESLDRSLFRRLIFFLQQTRNLKKYFFPLIKCVISTGFKHTYPLFLSLLVLIVIALICIKNSPLALWGASSSVFYFSTGHVKRSGIL